MRGSYTTYKGIWQRLRRDLRECSIYKPLWMVIPPGGTTIPCDVHPEGHFIQGNQITW